MFSLCVGVLLQTLNSNNVTCKHRASFLIRFGARLFSKPRFMCLHVGDDLLLKYAFTCAIHRLKVDRSRLLQYVQNWTIGPHRMNNKYLATELIMPIATKTCPQKGSFGAAPVDVEPRLFHHEI